MLLRPRDVLKGPCPALVVQPVEVVHLTAVLAELDGLAHLLLDLLHLLRRLHLLQLRVSRRRVQLVDRRRLHVDGVVLVQRAHLELVDLRLRHLQVGLVRGRIRFSLRVGCDEGQEDVLVRQGGVTAQVRKLDGNQEPLVFGFERDVQPPLVARRRNGAWRLSLEEGRVEGPPECRPREVDARRGLPGHHLLVGHAAHPHGARGVPAHDAQAAQLVGVVRVAGQVVKLAVLVAHPQARRVHVSVLARLAPEQLLGAVAAPGWRYRLHRWHRSRVVLCVLLPGAALVVGVAPGRCGVLLATLLHGCARIGWRLLLRVRARAATHGSARRLSPSAAVGAAAAAAAAAAVAARAVLAGAQALRRRGAFRAFLRGIGCGRRQSALRSFSRMLRPAAPLTRRQACVVCNEVQIL
eukprot:Rhum_TRINITY_DN14705_c12_g1::Rhum_TRINITY_DN14705_c12_g1_i1::g.112274::m.112274